MKQFNTPLEGVLELEEREQSLRGGQAQPACRFWRAENIFDCLYLARKRVPCKRGLSNGLLVVGILVSVFLESVEDEQLTVQLCHRGVDKGWLSFEYSLAFANKNIYIKKAVDPVEVCWFGDAFPFSDDFGIFATRQVKAPSAWWPLEGSNSPQLAHSPAVPAASSPVLSAPWRLGLLNYQDQGYVSFHGVFWRCSFAKQFLRNLFQALSKIIRQINQPASREHPGGGSPKVKAGDWVARKLGWEGTVWNSLFEDVWKF